MNILAEINARAYSTIYLPVCLKADISPSTVTDKTTNENLVVPVYHHFQSFSFLSWVTMYKVSWLTFTE